MSGAAEARSPASGTGPPVARLVVRLDDAFDGLPGGSGRPGLRSLALLALQARRRADRVSCLQIDDLQGLRMLSVDGPGRRVDVCLPAGTYHVRIHAAKVQLAYTLTLEPGSSFSLRPRTVSDPVGTGVAGRTATGVADGPLGIAAKALAAGIEASPGG